LGSRPAGVVVAAAGLAAVIVGGSTVSAAPASSSTAAAAVPTSSASSPAVDRDATSASAEASPIAAQSDETTSTVDVDVTGQVVGSAARTSALAAVGALEVKGRAPTTGYTRAQFGSGWVDTDHNGCDTRNDVLVRDLTGETFKPGTHDCVVLTGTLADPYSGTTIAFRRGQGTSEAVQIDHVVALSDAWQTGAQLWDAARRTAFANDQLNLLAVDGPLNEQKGDGDTATWLPPNKAYRCAYVARQVAVKVGYGLWVTPAERNAMATVLSACPDEPLPGGVVANVPQAAPTTTHAPAPAPAPAAAPGPYYANCDAARAASAAPLYAGQPGYRSGLDRDSDGVACEN
jgi:hypothetical protein